MFKFAEVGTRDFNSILRRSLVWRAKARFEDKQAIDAAYEDIAKDGVFPKDPSLPAFVTSGPAISQLGYKCNMRSRLLILKKSA